MRWSIRLGCDTQAHASQHVYRYDETADTLGMLLGFVLILPDEDVHRVFVITREPSTGEDYPHHRAH